MSYYYSYHRRKCSNTLSLNELPILPCSFSGKYFQGIMSLKSYPIHTLTFFYRISVFVYFNYCSTVIMNIFNYFCKTLSVALAKYLSVNCFCNELKTAVYSTESNSFSLSTKASEDGLLHSIVLSVN